jgi:hypothetical protein
VLVLSLLLHLALLSLVGLKPLRYGRIHPPRQPPIELTLEWPEPELAPAPGVEAGDVAVAPPAARVRLREKLPVATPRATPAPTELQAEFYMRMENGDYAAEIATRDMEEEKRNKQFGLPSSAYRSGAAPTPPPGGSWTEERLPDGTMRVTIFDGHGGKRCLETQPDDLLDEFDHGGYLMAATGGC